MEIRKVAVRWTLSFGIGIELWNWLVVLLVRCSHSSKLDLRCTVLCHPGAR